MDDVLSTLIDIHLSQSDAGSTIAKVTYERTALRPEANDHVRSLGASDGKMGKNLGGCHRQLFGQIEEMTLPLASLGANRLTEY
jgi:hypothetical protein